MQLEFTVDGEVWSINGDEARAPRTLRRLVDVLPLSLQLHTPKIAGSHIFWHAPFVEPVEGAVDVLQAGPGAFIYWPVRQFLEIVFAPLQAETASITVLGHLEGGVDRMAALGAALRRGHGRRRFNGFLRSKRGLAAGSPHFADDVLPAALQRRTRTLWTACPPEIEAMTRSRAIMHPVGPVLMAESEMRVLHESLFELHARALGGGEEVAIRYSAAFALERAGQRMRDFCHLPETGALLAELGALIEDRARPLVPVLEAATVAGGRIAAWLDLLIPWFDVNEAMRAALPSPKVFETQPGE